MRSTNHPQDELPVVEALTQLGEHLDGTRAVRAARARRLGRDIAASTWATRCFRSTPPVATNPTARPVSRAEL